MPTHGIHAGVFSEVDPHDHSAAAHLSPYNSSPRTFGILGDQWIADEIGKADEMNIFQSHPLEQERQAQRFKAVEDRQQRAADLCAMLNEMGPLESFMIWRAYINNSTDLEELKRTQKLVNDRVWELEPAQ